MHPNIPPYERLLAMAVKDIAREGGVSLVTAAQADAEGFDVGTLTEDAHNHIDNQQVQKA